MFRTLALLTSGTLALGGVVVGVSPAAATDGGRPLSARLTGAAEVPVPGDPDGRGTASLRLNPGQGEICVELSVQDIDPARAAHIHLGTAGVAGPVVVPLPAPTSGSSAACLDVDRDLALAIIRSPEDYYVNVHNAAFPAGALRGQLGR